MSNNQIFYSIIDQTTAAVGRENGLKGNGCNGECPKNIKIEEFYEFRSVKIIHELAFQSQNIESVELPQSIIEIRKLAFDINPITTLILPQNVEYLGSYCFASNNFTSVTIPKTVRFIGNCPFGANANLEKIEVDEQNPYYCTDIFGSLMTRNQTIFIQGLPKLETIVIPPTIHTIYTQSLDMRSLYKHIIIYNSIKRFDMNAFNTLDYLEKISYYGRTNVPDNVFIDIDTSNLKIEVCKDYIGDKFGDVDVTRTGFCFRPSIAHFKNYSKIPRNFLFVCLSGIYAK